jgi:hypothetical protein
MKTIAWAIMLVGLAHYEVYLRDKFPEDWLRNRKTLSWLTFISLLMVIILTLLPS